MAVRRTMGVVPILAAVWLLACTDSRKGGGESAQNANLGGTGGGAPSGSGGGPGAEYPKDVDVTDPSECDYEGYGGANAWGCAAVTIQLSEPVPLADLEIAVETDLGDTFTSFCVGTDAWSPGCPEEGPYLRADADPATRFMITTLNGAVYDPTSLSVSLTRSGATIASAELDTVTYSCTAFTNDDWCWQSAPLLVDIEN